jgi:hypothetical protein
VPEHHFVLVHGSWHDGSLLRPVADRLRALGHAVETPTIAGHGKGVDPRFTGRLGLCRLVQMPGSHEVLFTNPGLLAEKLVEAGRD